MLPQIAGATAVRAASSTELADFIRNHSPQKVGCRRAELAKTAFAFSAKPAGKVSPSSVADRRRTSNARLITGQRDMAEPPPGRQSRASQAIAEAVAGETNSR
ncbi:hypothetical protein GCM10027360_73480 [Amycolatopsis echigonensis]